MNELKILTATLKSDLKKMKILLTVLTIVEVCYFGSSFIGLKTTVVLDLKYQAIWIIWFFHYLTVGIFIWYTWKKMPLAKKAKIHNTIMVLFLGIIGMWLWFPSKKELSKLQEQ